MFLDGITGKAKSMILDDLWGSVDKLGSVITIANWGIALTLLFSFAFTVVSIKATSRKDALTKIAEQTASDHVANLDKANAALRGRVETLQESLKDRTISQDQENELIKLLAGKASGPVENKRFSVTPR